MTALPSITCRLPAGRFSPKQALVCFALAAMIDVAISAYRLPAVLKGALINPDSYMRLVRLQDILTEHAPVDVVARDGSGAGTVLHWSHLLDSLLLIVAAPLAALVGEHDALRWAGVALGPLNAGLLGMALAWAAAPLSDPAWRWTAALSGIIAMPILGYALPGVVHHHILVAVAAVMCAGWAGRVGLAGTSAGWQLGAWAAFGLWLTPEGMPIALMAFGAVGLGWLQHPSDRRWGAALAGGTTILAVLVALILAVDPPFGGYLTVEIDRISIAYLAMSAFGAAVGWLLYSLDWLGLAPQPRAFAGGAAAVMATVAWLALYPAVLAGPDGVLNGEHAHAFDGISEMLPVGSLEDAAFFLLQGVFGAAVAMSLAIRRRSLAFAYAASCVLLLVLAAALHRRFATYAACAGAIALPVAITLISTRLADRPPLWAASARLALLLFLFMAPLAAHFMFPSAGAAEAGRAGRCDVASAVAMLRPFTGQIVLADVNDTPEILYRTDLRTVGSLYHRDAAGYLRLRAAWRSSELDRLPQAVTATGASLLLFCRSAARSFMVADLPADTLWDRLRRSDPPVWLREVPQPPGSDFKIYDIVGSSQSHARIP
jgi:hypothetical protein